MKKFDELNSEAKVQFVKFITELGFDKRIGVFDHCHETFEDYYFLFTNKELVLDLKHELELPEQVSV